MSEQTLSKQPSESRIFGMSYSNKLRSSSETVASIDSISIYPSDGTLVAVEHSFGTDKANILVSGGETGKKYKITVIVTTSDAQVLENEGLLVVADE